jgi:WD40 repeat protein
MNPTCPQCQSTDVTYRSKKQCYICEDCNQEFVPEILFEPLRIFLSYGHDEYAAFAEKLRDDLIERGHEVWFDVDRLKPGGDWEQYIEEGLDWVSEQPGKGRMILIMTPHSVRRPDGFCLNEIARALDNHLFIIPVMLVECRLPLTISRIQWLDMKHSAQLPVPDGPYSKTLHYLFQSVEQKKLDFEGQASMLRSHLNPLSFEADLIHYQKWFTGREWVFKKIDEWLRNESSPRLFWITGLPGIGKTAIATQLCQKEPCITAFHLCKRGNSEKASPRRAVMSIAYQLSTQLPEYAGRLAAINLASLLSDADVNAAALFDTLILQPLAGDIPQPQMPQVILIDGLDEATQDGRNVMAEFIADEFMKLPAWLRLIITSRPDPEVTQPLQAWERWTLETGAAENLNDLEEYINKKLKSFSAGNFYDPDRIRETIVKNSEGIFLYAEWVCNELLEGKLAADKPEQFPRGLGEVYDRFFRGKLTTEKNYQADIATYGEKFRPVLELILAAREPLPMRLVTEWMHWDAYDERSFFKRFGSLFQCDPAACLRPFHTSVLDWLGDAAKAGDFFVDIRKGNLRLTEILWAEYTDKGALAVSEYGLKHLPFHLMKEQEWDNLTDLLCNLDFIQVKAAAKMTYELLNDFFLITQVFPDNAENILQENKRQALLDQYAKDLILYALGEVDKLLIPESIIPWTQEQTKEEIERIKKNPNRVDKLISFKNFLGQEANNLQKYSNCFPSLTFQQALNYAYVGPVAVIAKSFKTYNKYETIIIRLKQPDYFQYPILIHTLEGHTDVISRLYLTPDGQKAVSASMDKTLRIWNIKNGECLKVLKGHTSSVRALSVSLDRKIIVSGSDDGTIKLWDFESGTCIKTFEELKSSIFNVIISFDRKIIIVQCSDKSLYICKLNIGNHFMLFNEIAEEIESFKLLDDGKNILIRNSNNILKIIDIETGDCLKIFKGQSNWINSFSSTPDRKIAISGGDNFALNVWDLDDGKKILTLNGHKSIVFSVNVTPDGKLAISGSNDQTIRIWELKSGNCLKIIEGYLGWINSVRITPDGRKAISGSNSEIRIWDIEKGLYTDKVISKINRSFKIDALPFSGSLIFGEWENLVIYDNLEGRELNKLKGHHEKILCLKTTHDGKGAISGGWDHKILFWNIDKGRYIRIYTGHLKPITSINVTSSFSHIASGSKDKTLRLWEIKSGKCIKTFIGHNECLTCNCFSPDDKLLISGSIDKTIRIWDIRTGESVNILYGHTDIINDVIVTPNGKIIVSVGSDNLVKIWDLKSGICLKTLNYHTDKVNCVTTTPDGKNIISGSDDKTVRLWSVEKQQQIAIFMHSEKINSITYNNEILSLGTITSQIITLKIVNLSLDCIIATPVFLLNYDFEKNINKFDNHISAFCGLCSNRFQVPEKVHKLIRRINLSSNVTEKISPCLQLPNEAWEDPGLLCNCPKCGENLKFNPFIAAGEPFFKL